MTRPKERFEIFIVLMLFPLLSIAQTDDPNWMKKAEWALADLKLINGLYPEERRIASEIAKDEEAGSLSVNRDRYIAAYDELIKRFKEIHNEEIKESHINGIEYDKKTLDNRIKIENEAIRQREDNSRDPYISSYENELFKLAVDQYYIDVGSETPKIKLYCEFKNTRKIIRPKNAIYYANDTSISVENNGYLKLDMPGLSEPRIRLVDEFENKYKASSIKPALYGRDYEKGYQSGDILKVEISLIETPIRASKLFRVIVDTGFVGNDEIITFVLKNSFINKSAIYREGRDVPAKR